MQQIRACQPAFNAALVGYVEASRHEDTEKNLLCPPNPYPDAATDWISATCIAHRALATWLGDADLSAWMEAARLNATRGIGEHLTDPRINRPSPACSQTPSQPFRSWRRSRPRLSRRAAQPGGRPDPDRTGGGTSRDIEMAGGLVTRRIPVAGRCCPAMRPRQNAPARSNFMFGGCIDRGRADDGRR